MREAGELSIPFTTGILIGIGETREERVDSLFAIHELHETYGHIQEVIIQNFRAKPGTRMAGSSEPEALEIARTVAVARLILGGEMNIQVPPNLNPEDHQLLLRAGINDWGGISPVTRDYVNPKRRGLTSRLLPRPAEPQVSRCGNVLQSTTSSLWIDSFHRRFVASRPGSKTK